MRLEVATGYQDESREDDLFHVLLFLIENTKLSVVSGVKKALMAKQDIGMMEPDNMVVEQKIIF